LSEQPSPGGPGDVIRGIGPVAIADAAKVKGIAPLAAKTDRIDARVLAELTRRELVPEIWLPDPTVRAERERARFRLHLVHHRTALKNRIHATLMTFGHPVSVADLFGVAGRDVLARLALPDAWAATLATSLRMVMSSAARSTPARPTCDGSAPTTPPSGSS
jgi:transposase